MHFKPGYSLVSYCNSVVFGNATLLHTVILYAVWKNKIYNSAEIEPVEA